MDPSSTPIMLLYKPSLPAADQAAFVRAAFDACEQRTDDLGSDSASAVGGCRVRFLAEPLAVAAAGCARSALVLDVGEESTRAVPVYESMILPAGVRTTPLGGRDLTAYLAAMLESCTTDPYSAQSARRRLDIARAVKERHAYVAADFEAEVRLRLLEGKARWLVFCC